MSDYNGGYYNDDSYSGVPDFSDGDVGHGDISFDDAGVVEASSDDFWGEGHGESYERDGDA